MFPEGENDGLYHTADATLWFFHAIDRYVAATGDRATLRDASARSCADIVEHHVARHALRHRRRSGATACCAKAQEGYQLTWMDAKVGRLGRHARGAARPWRSTRSGTTRCACSKRWLREERDGAAAPSDTPPRPTACSASFNDASGTTSGGYLFDVVDGEQGDDPACRPNQLFAIALAAPGARSARAGRRCSNGRASAAHAGRPALARAAGTPTTSRATTATCARATPPITRARSWELAHRAVRRRVAEGAPGRRRGGARRCSTGFVAHLDEACIGTVSEVFDAEAPFTPRGCIAQAWSVAELLRAVVRLAEREEQPPAR